MKNEQEPIAWAFYDIMGDIRFIIHDKDRMELWSKGYEGDIVPLYDKPSDKPSDDRSSNSMVE